MRIIDSHMHFSNIASFLEYAVRYADVDYSGAGFVSERNGCGIVKSICMGLNEPSRHTFPAKDAETPMSADLESMPDGMYVCLGVNPHTLDEAAIQRLDGLLAGSATGQDGYIQRVVGMKVYAGYYHVDINDAVYEPVYRLAEKHGVPVAIHTGDTFSEDGLLEYAHPLRVDRLAVAHRDMKLIICHMGSPWLFDACETAYKNRNVHLDMSGLFTGSAVELARMMKKNYVMERLTQAIEFLDDYSKLLFGSDWPLAPMGAYVDLCKSLIPDTEWDRVFYSNALKVYDRLKMFIEEKK